MTDERSVLERLNAALSDAIGRERDVLDRLEAEGLIVRTEADVARLKARLDDEVPRFGLIDTDALAAVLEIVDEELGSVPVAE